jgi:hypothetical protein
MRRRKIMMIDIDGVVCEHVDNEHPEKMARAQAIPEAIARINDWYDQGHYICFFTARTDDHRTATENWLRDHGVKHQQVIFNKPRVQPGEEYHYIDDKPIRATTYKGRFTEFVRKQKEVLVFEND